MASSASAASITSADPRARITCTVTDPRITEASGLAVSRRHRGIVYVHNDSGDTARVFAVGPDGRTRAVFTIAGARNRDWEAMALGRDGAGRPALFLADIGDNLGDAWPYVTVYRVPEPATLRSQTLRATAFRLKYADGPRNAESVLVNPRTNRLYIASKKFDGALYAAPAKLRTSGFNVLHKVGSAPPIATDGAFAPDGRTFVIRTYTDAHVYAIAAKGRPGRELAIVQLPDQDQGESIAYTLDGRSLLAGSEGRDQPLWRVPLPAAARPARPERTTTATAGRPSAGSRDGREPPSGGLRGPIPLALGVAAVASVTAVAVLAAAARRRS
ncbi:MAG TPA: hypothetical protein VF069_23545 [Streptosporangiaceae bacterium]